MKKVLLFLLLALAARAAFAAEARRVVFFGDSLTAGYGVDPAEAFPSLVQDKIDAAQLPFRVVHAGLSGDTTAAAARRVNWVLKAPADVFVIALGGNDGLRGIPPAATRANLQRIIDAARKAHPAMTVVLCGMKMPPNYGEAYTKAFASIFPALAAENDLPFVPFLLEGVGGVGELNLPDRIHPTAEGHAIVAETVWKTLRPVLERRLSRPAPAKRGA